MLSIAIYIYHNASLEKVCAFIHANRGSGTRIRCCRFGYNRVFEKEGITTGMDEDWDGDDIGGGG